MTDDIDDESDHLYRLTEIEWDTDGETIPGLPDAIEAWAGSEDHAVDVASDEIGWCIERCFVERSPEADE